MHLALINMWSIFNPHYTIRNEFGIPSHKVSCTISCSMNMADLPVLDLLPPSPCSSYNHWIEVGGRHLPNRALVTSWASPSKITCLSPRSPASSKPSSNTLASTSIAPNSRFSFLLIAPIIWPCSFLITTPTPQLPNSLNTAPSTLILYHPSQGGLHPSVLGGADWFTAAFNELNSSTSNSASLVIAFTTLHRPSNFMEFLFFQMHHAIVAKVSQLISLLSSQIFHTTSMKSRNVLRNIDKGSFDSLQTASATSQSQRAEHSAP